MYIRRIEINNIRSIEHFEMTFPKGQEAGWHVLVGDNGSGKSTIMRSVALCLLDYTDMIAARQNWDDWLKKDRNSGGIVLEVLPHEKYDSSKENQEFTTNSVSFERDDEFHDTVEIGEVIFHGVLRYKKLNVQSIDDDTIQTKGRSSRRIFYAWFSAAYGPFRRFMGGDHQKEALERSNPRLVAHLSIFGEDVALTGALVYLRELYLDSLDPKNSFGRLAELTLELVSNFINHSDILPYKTKIDYVSKEGIFIKDANGHSISILEMSDGYRSVLSLVIDLLRHIISAYSIVDDFDETYSPGESIKFPGVVLIDEVDAHLHPTWQTRIGQWFTKYFPNIQFIVTTHSPLVCRAADKGTIWRLPTPGSDEVAQEITGDEKKRLVFGNVLDAYGTDAFGDNVARSELASDKLKELARLNIKSIMGKIDPSEEQKLLELRSIFPTEG